jgi:O-antigen/teichoic acid export membrane protein
MGNLKNNLHVYSTMIYRVNTIVLGGGLILTIPLAVDILTQGYIFVFLSLIALQHIFDFGMNQSLIQIISFNVKKNYLKNIEIANFIKKLYKKISTIFAVCIFILGYYIFESKGEEINWFKPWLIMVISSGINMYYSPLLSILEGNGDITKVSIIRGIGNLFGYSLAILLLYNDFGLYSITAIPVFNVLSSAYFLRNNKLIYHNSIYKLSSFSWKKEIFPLQWRIGLSWIFGYVVQQLTPIIIFHRLNTEEAGKIGLITSLMNAICMFSLSILSANIPNFSMLLSVDKKEEMKNLFKKSLLIALLKMIIISHLFILMVLVLNKYEISIVERLPRIIEIYIIILTYIINIVIFAYAMFIRSFKEDPTVSMTVILGLISLVIIMMLSNKGLLFYLIPNFIVTLTIGLPWMHKIFIRYYKK